MSLCLAHEAPLAPHTSLHKIHLALITGFANQLARRMPLHNGYRTLGERPTLAQVGSRSGTEGSAALILCTKRPLQPALPTPWHCLWAPTT